MPGENLCPVAGTVGNMFPDLIIKLIGIFSEAEPFAAFHAAQTYRSSAEGQRQSALTLPTMHIRIQ